VPLIDIDSEQPRRRRLRIEIDNQDRSAGTSQCGRSSERHGRLPHAALLVRERLRLTQPGLLQTCMRVCAHAEDERSGPARSADDVSQSRQFSS